MKPATIASKIERYAPQDGITDTATPYIKLFRVSSAEQAQPVCYEPCIVIVGQGQKCGYLGEKKFIYNQDNYLVMSLPMPFQCEVEQASEEKPFLGLGVFIDAVDISQLLMDMVKVDHPQIKEDTNSKQDPQAALASPMDDHIRGIAHRILDALDNDDDAKLLIPLYVKELMFRVLQGGATASRAASSVGYASSSQFSREYKRFFGVAPSADMERLS